MHDARRERANAFAAAAPVGASGRARSKDVPAASRRRRAPTASAGEPATALETTRGATPRAPAFELARATSSKGTKKSATKKRKGEFYQVVRVRGDGRCMFRALALGLAALAKRNVTSGEEEFEADQLRLAVAESLCRTAEKRANFGEAVTAISFEVGLETYCRRILEPTFWGGEPELLVLSRLIRRPIKVYINASQARNAEGGGFVDIQTYGEEFSKEGKRKPVRLLYNGENHYDLLL
jgi:hypothetical protein